MRPDRAFAWFRASSLCLGTGLATGLGVGLAVLPATTSAAERPPAEQYRLHCSGCHGPDGRGAPPATPGLHDLAPVLEAPGGRAYLARVPGVAQAPIDDTALALLLGWVLREFSQVTARPPFSAEEIGALRRAPLRDPAAARPVPVLSDPASRFLEGRRIP